MDPDNSPHLPSDRPAPQRRIPSPPERIPPVSAVPGPSQPSNRSQTTLPPIHQLHPGLAHTAMQPPPPSSTPYMHGATYPLTSTSSLGIRNAPEDSDQEASQGRQKQKRRRQALSCTECKRRKIKCDRANPCGPCVRRGEQTKCQWHIIEPMEKYVTRTEFDELKARVQELEAVLRGAPPASSSSGQIPRRPSMSAMMPMTSGPAPEPIQGTAITPYQAYGTPGAVSSYSLRPASPRSPLRGGEAPPYHRIPNPGTTRSPTIGYRPPPTMSSGSGGAARAGPSGPPPPPPAPTSSNASAASPHSPPKPLSPSLSTLRASAPRRQSISLADLTAPYNTEPKPPPPPKNYSAQTTALPGPRLRPSPPPGPDRVEYPRHPIPIADTRQRVPV
ncbi:transcription factor [Ganoderma sinense ZZ0214-1]|uniref:Transcription factor n=1 Tax=Ganoderma sinense ZZ0214-1 TaxID=1077348 RepID=A0A2G8RSN0_9APHY|nr:transcription factor [Ganoderma sinense ZZ0214-1]